jgi:hypothetical protein
LHHLPSVVAPDAIFNITEFCFWRRGSSERSEVKWMRG